MTLTTRSGKGSALTHAEMDANWSHLGDSANSSYTPSGSGAVVTTVQNWMRQFPTLKGDFGAVGDGTTDDSTAINSADALGKRVYLANGTFLGSSVGPTTLDGPYWGDGQIKDSSGNKRAKYMAAIKAAPSSLGDEDSLETAFNGDWSKGQFPVEHRITGAATLGQPTSGYTYTPEAYPHYTYLYSSSGHNNSTSANTGRTAAVAYRTKVYQHGDGDAVAFNASGFVDSTKSGSTSFLANPAAVCFNGDLSAGADGVYLNWGEALNTDAGFDVAAIGWVLRSNRTVNTGAKNAWWAGLRVQSEGTKEIDVGVSLMGPMNIGLDTTFATLPSSGTYISAAMTLKANQRIYMNANGTDASGISRYSSSLATDYFTYSSALSAFNFVVNNQSSLQIYTSQVVANQDLNIASGKVLKNNSTQVLGARNTGWTAMTGSADKATAYDTSTITLPQLAGRVMNLQIALTTHGVIGA